MNGQLTPNDVVLQLAALARELDVTVDQLKAAEVEAVDKRHGADLATSKAFLSADGSVDQRKHTAFVATERLAHNAELAEAVVRHLRRRISAIGTRIDVGRSCNAALRSELALSSAGGTP